MPPCAIADAGEDLVDASGYLPSPHRGLLRFRSVQRRFVNGCINCQRRSTCRFGQIQDRFASEERLLVPILDFDVDHMYYLVVLTTPVQQV